MAKNLIGCLVATAVIGGCAKKTGSLTGSVGVANKVTASSLELGETEPFVDELDLDTSSTATSFNQKLSFNPTSFKVTFTGIQLCRVGNEGPDPNGSGRLGCMDTRNSVKLEGQKEVEFMNQAPFNALAGFDASKITKTDFASYGTAMIGYQGTATVSGTATIGGKLRTLSNLPVVAGGLGIAARLGSPVTFDEKHSPNIQVFFDVNSPIYLFNSLAGSSPAGSTKVEDAIYARVANWAMFVYAGTGTPTFEAYDVVLDSSDFGDPSQYKLRVSILRDDQGKYYSAAWHPVYTGLNEPQTAPFEICDLDTQYSSSNADGSYKLSSVTGSAYCTSSPAVGKTLQVVFPSFALSSHTGSVQIGSKTYNYTATKD